MIIIRRRWIYLNANDKKCSLYSREEEGPNIRISFEDQMLQFVRNYANPTPYISKVGSLQITRILFWKRYFVFIIQQKYELYIVRGKRSYLMREEIFYF